MAETYEIEKNVPIPKLPGRHGRPAIYQWHKMEIGDSFFVAGKSAQETGLASQGNKQCAPKRFIARTVEGGTRVWRIA